jgi:hypothetical protein
MSSSHLFFSRLKRHLVSATQFLLRHCKTWLQLLTLSNSTWLFCYLHPTTHVFRQTPLFCCWLGSAFRLQASASSLLLFPFLFLVGTELNTLSIYKKVACRGEPPMRRNEMSAPTKWTAAPTQWTLAQRTQPTYDGRHRNLQHAQDLQQATGGPRYSGTQSSVSSD